MRITGIIVLTTFAFYHLSNCSATTKSDQIFKRAFPLAELTKTQSSALELRANDVHFFCGFYIGALLQVSCAVGAIALESGTDYHDMDAIFAQAGETTSDKIIYGSSIATGLAVSRILKYRYNRFFNHDAAALKIVTQAGCTNTNEHDVDEFKAKYRDLRDRLDRERHFSELALVNEGRRCDTALAQLSPTRMHPGITGKFHNQLCAEAVCTYKRMRFVDGLTSGSMINPVVLVSILCVLKDAAIEKTIEYKDLAMQKTTEYCESICSQVNQNK